MLHRRQFLPLLCSGASLAALPAATRIDRDRISVITDEVATSPAEAIAFCKQHGLRWVEVRQVPGTRRPYWDQPRPEQDRLLADLKNHELRVSFVDSGLLTCPVPGTTPALRPGETPEVRAKRMLAEAPRFEKRMDELRRVIDFAHRAGCDKIRFFAFRRVEDPQALLPRIAELLGPMVDYAASEGVQMLLENEASCNVNTCEEIRALLRLLPAKAVALNWDPGNARNAEQAYPDGYRKLPAGRLANVQIKGADILAGNGAHNDSPIDWTAILQALNRDGYRGHIGLETHTKNRVAESPAAMREIQRIVDTLP